MTYKTKQIKDASDIELLAELIERNGYTGAPTEIKLSSGHLESIIGIGDDDVASLLIDSESVEVLKSMVGD